MIWTDGERAAWAPPEILTVSAWAERDREIVSKDAAERGHWRNARAPYLRGIMDALSDPEVEEVYLMKAARVGGSEVGRNFLCSTVAEAAGPNSAGPFLIVFPDEETAKKQLANEIFPLLDTDALRSYQTGAPRDLSKGQIELLHMRIYPAWSGSPTTLAEKTIRYVWVSEADKLQAFSGREADPLSLAKTRTQTFGNRRKVFVESTPTTRAGVIARAWEAATDRRRYWVPCPRCGAFQVLTWAQVKWPKEDGVARRVLAARVEAQESAWYECAHCHGKIDESDKSGILDLGEWRLEPGCEPGPIRAFHVSGLLSMLGLTWSRMAAQWLRARESYHEGDIGPQMEFVTQKLGEPWEDVAANLSDQVLEKKRAAGHAPKIVPKWGGLLIATADTQRDGFWYVVRAWGRGERSRLIDRGRAASFDELDKALRATTYKIEGWDAEFVGIGMLAIDAGGGGQEQHDTSLTDEVYRFCLARPGWAYPIKGWGGMGKPKDGKPVWYTDHEYTPPGGKRNPYKVPLHMIDTQYFKGVLAGLMNAASAEAADAERWQLCADVDAEYVAHMTAERKIHVRARGGIVERWERIGQRANHLYDAEVYQLAAAKIARAELLPDEAALEATRAEAERARNTASQRRPGGAPTKESPGGRFATSDGRPFLACRRDPR